ncbi:cupin domain-containing protein [Flavisphingomonas formosensis]|uniref:cupin domain-containing protein n=1 Tax=Flavisphingomonas formosensis TaxID=861534 RepID=UPI001E30EDAD|nr:cupin domain-containing protein [Sphingomonas formosensis]
MNVFPAILDADSIRQLAAPGGAACRMLVSSFAAGLRVPEEGRSQHDEIEISLVLSGAFDLESGGERRRIEAGDAVVVPAGESHFFHVLADTRIFTVTVGGA